MAIACETCVQMTLENESMEQKLIRAQRRIRIYVSLVRSLRDRVNELQKESDAIFESLHEADMEAEILTNDVAAGLVEVEND